MPAATVVVLRLIRQWHEVVSVLLGKMIEASANHLNANLPGGLMNNETPAVQLLQHLPNRAKATTDLSWS
jgi:hypothetical protein